jgi:hypothetical protein
VLGDTARIDMAGRSGVVRRVRPLALWRGAFDRLRFEARELRPL